jgi:hypothetical protein
MAEEMVNNGLMLVPKILVEYRGYRIVPKLDFGRRPFLINGVWVSSGYVVTDGMCNVMPGAAWAESVPEAQAMIDAFVEAAGDAQRFWEVMRSR